MQRPEGKLLQHALERSGLSARKAAAQIGISDSRLRHIIRGYQPLGRGQTVEVIAPADTLGRIAYTLGVTPQDLERAGRADAAESMDAARRGALHDRFDWPVDRQQRVQARLDAEAWFQSGMDAPVPRALLRVITNDDLIAEVRRRIEVVEATAAAPDPANASPVTSIEDRRAAANETDELQQPPGAPED